MNQLPPQTIKSIQIMAIILMQILLNSTVCDGFEGAQKLASGSSKDLNKFYVLWKKIHTADSK